jgi:hypothetical protein
VPTDDGAEAFADAQDIAAVAAATLASPDAHAGAQYAPTGPEALTVGDPADDGGVVLVDLTQTGSVALEDHRTRAGEVLGARLAEIPDDQVDALAAATEALAQLIAPLQKRPVR